MKKWTTKDGRKIPIKDLSDRHLVNIISYFFRNSDAYKEGLRQHYWEEGESALCFPFQGEMAQYAAEQEGNELLDLSAEIANTEIPIVPDEMPDLIAECKKRKLELPPEYTPIFTTVKEIKVNSY